MSVILNIIPIITLSGCNIISIIMSVILKYTLQCGRYYCRYYVSACEYNLKYVWRFRNTGLKKRFGKKFSLQRQETSHPPKICIGLTIREFCSFLRRHYIITYSARWCHIELFYAILRKSEKVALDILILHMKNLCLKSKFHLSNITMLK